MYWSDAYSENERKEGTYEGDFIAISKGLAKQTLAGFNGFLPIETRSDVFLEM